MSEPRGILRGRAACAFPQKTEKQLSSAAAAHFVARVVNMTQLHGNISQEENIALRSIHAIETNTNM